MSSSKRFWEDFVMVNSLIEEGDGFRLAVGSLGHKTDSVQLPCAFWLYVVFAWFWEMVQGEL